MRLKRLPLNHRRWGCRCHRWQLVSWWHRTLLCCEVSLEKVQRLLRSLPLFSRSPTWLLQQCRGGMMVREWYCCVGCPLDIQHTCCHRDHHRHRIFEVLATYHSILLESWLKAISHSELSRFYLHLLSWQFQRLYWLQKTWQSRKPWNWLYWSGKRAEYFAASF